MRNFLIGTFFTIVSILILLASIYGTLTQKETVIRGVGTMQIATFENGLALFQNFRGQFFNISPFNDYLIYTDGSRNALVSQEQIIAKQYSSSYTQSHWEQIRDSVQAYFGQKQPSYTLLSPIRATYDTTVDGNKLTIRKTVEDRSIYNSRVTGITLSYKDSSFIFDEEKKLYVPHSAQEIAQFEQLHGIKLKPQTEEGELRFEIPSRTLYIVNPYITGIIVVKAEPNQRLFVNRNFNIIEVEDEIQPNQGSVSTTLQIEVADFVF